MFSYIVGKITYRSESGIILENNGIGYEITMSSYALKCLEDMQEEVKIHTYFQVRDDGVSLFGFYTLDEKEMFLNLISVSGVGPKGAITILSNVSYGDLEVVISSQDLKTLSSIKGIGKKTAERLIIELKDKVGISSPAGSAVFESVSLNSEISDAIEVLFGLGVSRMEATKLAQSCYVSGDSAEEIIRKALSQMRN